MRKVMAFGLAMAAASMAAVATAAPLFAPGNLVVSVEGSGVWGATSGSYTTNQAAPLTLMQFSHAGTTSASYVSSLVLPGSISGEYGSSSEGFLHLSGDGTSLTLMGYGVNAAAFNANPTAYGTAVNNPAKPTALGQSGSLTGQGYTPVARVVAVIDGNGAVDTSTQLYNVFNGNNPRSAYTIDGKSFYVSGQGLDADTTGGVFLAAKGASAATAITGKDSTPVGGVYTTAQDTRDVQVRNGQLYVSTDSKAGSDAARSFVGTLGAAGALPTDIANGGQGPSPLAGFGFGNPGKLDQGMQVITAANTNGINSAGQTINLSPEQFFFASDTVMYVADSGAPKNDSASSGRGDGGLQKWIYSTTTNTWSLAYTLTAGLQNFVRNNAASGTTGLFGLTGLVNGNSVELYATNYTITGVEQTYLYGITDILAATVKPTGAATESFSVLAAAPANSTFKGVAFAPAAADVPEPASWALMALGFGAIGAAARRRRPLAA